MPKWKRSLCGCCDAECCIACVAPYYPYYMNLSVMKESGVRSSVPYCGNALLPACIYGAAFYAVVVGPCVYACTLSSAANSTTCLSLVPCTMHCATRGNIRAAHNIGGSCCEDCCTVLCCYSCALVQEMDQLDYAVKEQRNSMAERRGQANGDGDPAWLAMSGVKK